MSAYLADALGERIPSLFFLSLLVTLSSFTQRRMPVQNLERRENHCLEGAFWFAEGAGAPRLLVGRERVEVLSAMRGCSGAAPLYPGALARLWEGGRVGILSNGSHHHMGSKRCRVTIETFSADRRFAIGFPLSLAHATERELQLLRGIGASRAAAIVSARTDAPLLTREALLAVHGIGPKTVEKLLPRLQLSSPRALWSPDGTVDNESD